MDFVLMIFRLVKKILIAVMFRMVVLKAYARVPVEVISVSKEIAHVVFAESQFLLKQQINAQLDQA